MKLFTLIVMITFLGGCYSATKPLSLPENEVISTYEKRLWKHAEEEQRAIGERDMLCNNEELRHYLNELAKKINPVNTDKTFSFQVEVIKSPRFDAFSYPNGLIYLTTGILVRIDNEAQLAFILGHEMAHCMLKHTLKSFTYLKNRSTFSEGGSIGRAYPIGSETEGISFDSLTSKYAMLGYLQEFEIEADNKGLELIIKAGYDVGEVLKVFTYLSEELNAASLTASHSFSFHTDLQRRSNNYKRMLNRLMDRNEGIKCAERFLTKTQGIILDNVQLDLKVGRFNSAQRGTNKFLSVHPNNARAHYLLGEIARQRGKGDDFLRAQASYKRAVTIKPTFSEPYKAMGLLYYKQGKKKLAKRSFELCLSLSPQRQDKHYILGYLEQCNQ